MTIAEDDLAIIHDPQSDEAFHVEQHGVDFIPLSERWARPRDLFGMWAGASVNIEYFIYGAVLMTFGFNFAQALSLIILGNLSYFLLGLCSLQAPQTGTTVFAINRASYGPNGSRLISFFNWLTQIGFEVEGLILIVGAALATAGAVSVSGVIAFVGLIVPHLARRVVGPDLRMLVPAGILIGAALVVLADALARTIAAPAEIPLGVLLAFVGVPTFLVLYLRGIARAYA